MSAHEISGPNPVISIIVANYNCVQYLPSCLNSITKQTFRDLEIIVSDDASTDDSCKIVNDFIQADSRIRLLASTVTRGPAKARNDALDIARGEWIAIVDADDLIHPQRFQRLIEAARRFDADAVADDLLHFQSATVAPVSFLLKNDDFNKPVFISPEFFIQCNSGDATKPALGYLKPIFKRSLLAELRYDETLMIAEDYDLLLRLLFKNVRLLVVPEPYYLYRRHSHSISHRLSEKTVSHMIENHLQTMKAEQSKSPSYWPALMARKESLEHLLAFERLVTAIKQKHVLRAVGIAVFRPALITRLFESFRQHFAKKNKEGGKPSADVRASGVTDVCMVLAEGELNESATGRIHGILSSQKSLIYRKESPLDCPTWSAESGDAKGLRERIKYLVELTASNKSVVMYAGPAGLYTAGFLPRSFETEGVVNLDNDQ